MSEILVKAHRDRLWKAMGEIENKMKSQQKQLEGLYKQKLWIPIEERRKTATDSAVPLPDYFDGLAEWVEFLRPIIYGVK